MKLSEAFKTALKAIWSSKMRSMLTMLGVIIGVFAVTALVALGQGATNQTMDMFESLGTNMLTVNVFNQRINYQLTMEDIEAMTAKDNVHKIAPIVQGNATGKAGTNNTSVSISATTPEYMEIRDYKLLSGRQLITNDIDNKFRVAVIGVETADELFGHREVVGSTFSLNGTEFKIIGILEPQGTSIFGSSDNIAIIPFTTGQRLLKNKTLRTFYASAETSDQVNTAQAEIEDYLLAKFGDDDSYRVFNQTQMLETGTDMMSTLTGMLAGIAAISLLVGGIGIMNIMLVSVTERTREIGIRKAIGAKRRDIMAQFLIESVAICLLGGIIGGILGVTVSNFVARLVGFTAAVSVEVLLLAGGFSIIIGLIFGLYPAWKASRLHPIQALRYE